MTHPAHVPAVAYQACLPITDPESLIDTVVELPAPGPRDLVVKVEAVSVNPIDVRLRAGRDPKGRPRVLGLDAAGTVVSSGTDASIFTEGDDVYYCGDVRRPGTNAAYHVVDERLVGRKPASIGFADAAALPLTALTAWESLFHRLRLTEESRGTLWVIGGGGGVASMAIQLARQLTQATIITTVSRAPSRAWAQRMGAHHVVSDEELSAVIEGVDGKGVDWIISGDTERKFLQITDAIAPRGQVVVMDEPRDINLLALKSKSISWHWEALFTDQLHNVPETGQRHLWLTEIAELVDRGAIVPITGQVLGPLNASTMRRAHADVESRAHTGKTVVTSDVPSSEI
ncbi:zinc-binding alcohol dehydrogenase family protein [Aeromicrobium sp. CF4.19]|uniref:zinc-binding alcohol dehydrogenase family protein n=1 Tax=Aeromicrobium sp. CF4.19 TaxID=3373082 RepID=UPI003EE74F23